MFTPHATDFYKTGHIFQYPEGTETVYSNGTFRSDKHAIVLPDFDHKVVFFNMQAICQWLLIDHWNKHFFSVPKADAVARYKRRMDSSLGPNAVSVNHIAELHDLGYLPIVINALPEGSRVNIRVPAFTIWNTIKRFYWITNYLETQISAEIWKPCTNATIAYEYRRLLDKYAKITGSPKEFVQWQGHDFSARGMSGIHDNASSGAAHLLSFTGTDSILGIDYLDDYYYGQGFIGGSVPATEHSVMCMGGKESEIDTYTRLITKVYPDGVVSIVSDTWDFWRVINDYTVRLKDTILARSGKVVFRPDSGDPVKIIIGDPEGSTPEERKGAVECLWDIFGGVITPTGHKLLDPHVGLIYGDSITLDIAQRILEGLNCKGFASANIVFGIGSFTYQYVTRDTFGFAIKSTYGIVNEEPIELFKKPKTDDGVKNSACGLIRVEKEGDDFVLYDRQTPVQAGGGKLETVFQNGVLVRQQSYEGVRKILGTF